MSPLSRKCPIAIHQQEANDQHYEVPAEYYKLCLGPHLKYSSCFFKVKLTIIQIEYFQNRDCFIQG